MSEIKNCWRCGTLTTVVDGRCRKCNLDICVHPLQPLMLDLQKIRKLAHDSKLFAAGMVGPSAQQELMMIERTADVLVARVLDEMGASCDRSKFGGSNDVSQPYSAPETDKPLFPPWCCPECGSSNVGDAAAATYCSSMCKDCGYKWDKATGAAG